jgi:hypothetical protein
VKVRMARNEFEPVAFAVYANEQTLERVNYTVTSLRGPDGDLDCELDLRTAEFAPVQAEVDYGRSTDSGKYCLYHQRLWPKYPVDIPAGRSQLFWITIKTLG